MKKFMDEDFLLNNNTAGRLYHDYAEKMPIFDYHCHLNPKDIAEDRKFRNITEAWLGGDHYKWRALRSNGVDEKYITGDAGDKEKFMKWAETMPACIGNPLYHWTHLELKRYFGINELLSPETAGEIWDRCNDMLKTDDFSVRGLIKRSNVRVICTTDDPADSLEYHSALAGDEGFGVKVVPAFRPDRFFHAERDGFPGTIARLSESSGVDVDGFSGLKDALVKRMEMFHAAGCRISDHALDPLVFNRASDKETDSILKKALNGGELTAVELEKYKTGVMLFLGRRYAALGWTMQLHVGVIRNANGRMMAKLGPDTGFDAIGDYRYASSLAGFMSALDETDELPRTILYCLNPGDNEMLAAIAGCFQGGGVPGKIQFGSGWWFNDQKDGMIRQMTALSNLGLLSRFVGMLTDSRSFLSYARHEYFRRILCNLIGGWVENGEAPDDMDLLGKMVGDICWSNACNYFGIEI